MKRLICLTVLSLWFGTACAQEIVSDPCDTLQRCIERISEVVDAESNYLSNAERALVQRLVELGQSAVPVLVVALSDPDESVADFAAAGLRDMEHIDAAYLPQIIIGLDRGLKWLPGALGRINTDEAAAEAVARLVKARIAFNQEGYAIRLLGVRAVPYLVDAARCEVGGCDDSYYSTIEEALRYTGADPTAVAAELFAITRETSAPDVLQGVLYLIRWLGEDARFLEDDLVALRGSHPELTAQIADALISMHSPYAANELARRLTEHTDVIYLQLNLRDLAELGLNGVSAGPTVAGLLDSLEPDVRLAAVRTLGFIGFRGAINAIEPFLRDPVDVRLNAVAVEALGRLRADSAIAALEEIASGHWYPPVRAEARTAIANINTGMEYPNVGGLSAFFSPWERGWKIEPCRYVAMDPVSNEFEQRLFPSENPDLFALFEHDDTELVGPITPEFAVRVTDGWLTGSDHGEWNGELHHFHDDGTKTLLLHDNITNIHRVGDTFLAVGGLAKLSINSGAVHQVSQNSDGVWQATVWRILPGIPRVSQLMESGELLVSGNEGSILIDPNGTMRMAPCIDQP